MRTKSGARYLCTAMTPQIYTRKKNFVKSIIRRFKDHLQSPKIIILNFFAVKGAFILISFTLKASLRPRMIIEETLWPLKGILLDGLARKRSRCFSFSFDGQRTQSKDSQSFRLLSLEIFTVFHGVVKVLLLSAVPLKRLKMN